MDNSLLKVGTLAQETGLTVRTLHYYEEKGLLKPAHRSEKGYRLYGIEEVQRLQQILSLQQLGFPLDEIRMLLDQEDYSLQRVLELHMLKVREKVVQQQQLLSRLESITAHLQKKEMLSVEELIQTIKLTSMHEKYYTPEQLDTLKKRAEALGEAGMQKGQDDWTELNNAFREAMETGTDPAAPEVQALVAKMQELIQAFTGGDAGIERSLGKMYDAEGPEAASHGMMDKALFEYVGKARQHYQG